MCVRIAAKGSAGEQTDFILYSVLLFKIKTPDLTGQAAASENFKEIVDDELFHCILFAGCSRQLQEY